MQLPQFGSWWLHLRSWNSILHSKHQSPELESVAVLPRLVVGSDLNLSIVPHEWVAFTWQETWKCNLPCKVAESEMIIPENQREKLLSGMLSLVCARLRLRKLYLEICMFCDTSRFHLRILESCCSRIWSTDVLVPTTPLQRPKWLNICNICKVMP